MSRDIASGPDFNVLADYLRGELGRLAADERAVHLASQRSFARWAETVIGRLAEGLGVTVGFLAGYLVAVYDSVKDGFSVGWERGYSRGRGPK